MGREIEDVYPVSVFNRVGSQMRAGEASIAELAVVSERYQHLILEIQYLSARTK